MAGCCSFLSSGRSKVQQEPKKDVIEQKEEEVEEKKADGVPDILLNPNAVLNDSARWRHGSTPDYSKANANYAAQKSKDWEKGSLEDMVSNLVKNWEKEASYKVDASEWRTIDKEKYQFSCNGGEKYTVNDMLRLGTYNALIGETELYNAKVIDFETSHEVFRKAMPEGFSWEVLHVYSGPPDAVFKWRHWGKMSGKLQCPLGHGTLEAEPTNGLVEIIGMAVAKVDPANGFKISEIEIYYDQNEIMKQLAVNNNKATPPSSVAGGGH